MSPEEVKAAKIRLNEANKKMSEAIRVAIEQGQPSIVYEKYKAKPEQKVNLVEPVKDRIYGSKKAKNRIIAMSDFACGHCSVASRELKARVDENKGLVNLTPVFYPLDKACNPDLKGKLSDYSCFSAKLALCAEKQGKVWKAIDYLYDNQAVGSAKPFDKASFIKRMEQKLKLSKLDDCINSDWLKERIKKENEVYAGMKLPGTPFIILNDRQLGNVFKFKKSFHDFIVYLDSKENPKRK